MDINKSLDELINEATTLSEEQEKKIKERAMKKAQEIINLEVNTYKKD